MLLNSNCSAVATCSGFEKIIETLIAAEVFIEPGSISLLLDLYFVLDELTSSIVNPLHLAVLQSRDDIVKGKTNSKCC